MEYIEITKDDVVKEPKRVSIGDGTLKDTDTMWYKEWTNRMGQLTFGDRLLSEVNEGDVLRIAFDSEGAISAFAVLFGYEQITAANGSPAYALYTDNALSGTTLVALCHVTSITPDGKIVCCYSENYDLSKVIVGKPRNVVKYIEGAGFETVTANDIQVGDTVVVRGQDGLFRDIVIYE